MRYNLTQYKELKKKLSLEKPTDSSNKKIAKDYNAEVIASILNSEMEYSISDNTITIIFKGAKLFSTNKIFALLQSQKYILFKYKKAWHNKIRMSLEEISKKNNLTIIDKPIELELLRCAKRMVDEDAMMTMFKYIIDGLKYDKLKNPHGILRDDNKNIVRRISCYNLKSDYVIGVKIKISKTEVSEISLNDFLSNN